MVLNRRQFSSPPQKLFGNAYRYFLGRGPGILLNVLQCTDNTRNHSNIACATVERPCSGVGGRYRWGGCWPHRNLVVYKWNTFTTATYKESHQVTRPWNLSTGFVLHLPRVIWSGSTVRQGDQPLRVLLELSWFEN